MISTEKKAIKIISFVCLGTQCLAALILLILIANEKTIYSLSGMRDSAITGQFVIPWTVVIPVFSHLCFAILLVVLANKLKGKALKIAGIAIAVAFLLNSLSSTVQSIVGTQMAAMNGVNYLAANNIVTSMSVTIINPLLTVGTIGIVFACGMMACMKD